MSQWRKRRIDVFNEMEIQGGWTRSRSTKRRTLGNVPKSLGIADFRHPRLHLRHLTTTTTNLQTSNPFPLNSFYKFYHTYPRKTFSNMGRVSKYFEGIMQDPVVWRTYEVTNCNENMSKIIGKLKNMPFLKELTINHRKDSDKILRQISLMNKNLEKLYIYNCTGSTSKFYLRSHYLTCILEKCRRLNTIEILGSPFRGRKFYKLLGDVGLRLKCASLPTRHSQFITFIQNAQQIYDNRLNTYIMCFLPWRKHAQLHYSINRKATFRTVRIKYSSKYAISIDITEDGKRNVHLISMINKATGREMYS